MFKIKTTRSNYLITPQFLHPHHLQQIQDEHKVLYTLSLSVLALAGTELIFFRVAGTVLGFDFTLRIRLTTTSIESSSSHLKEPLPR